MNTTHETACSVRTRYRSVPILGVSLVLCGLLWATMPSLALARPGASDPAGPLPPRVTAVPQPETQSSAPSTTAIHLVVQVDDPALTVASLWAEVEWQDGAGAWHAVTGWRGPLRAVSETQGEATWYLGSGQSGAGPFRWCLYKGQDGELLASSASFSLPDKEGNTVTVEMQVSPQPLLPQSGGVFPALAAAGGALVVGAALCIAARREPRRRLA